MMKIREFLQSLLIRLIKVYRFCFSLLLGPRCRFEPTCSSYAMQAIKIHGSFKGCYYALRRILRCHPWHSGGVDPVPLKNKLSTDPK